MELVIQPDHVHLFVRVWTTDSAADVVKACKYASLKKLPSMWTRSYFAATAGNLSQEAIRRYIEAQKGI